MISTKYFENQPPINDPIVPPKAVAKTKPATPTGSKAALNAQLTLETPVAAPSFCTHP